MVLNFVGKKGFTLIELIVSVGLVSILAVSAVVALSNLKDKKSISSEASEIKAQIKKARSMALNPSEEFSSYNYFGVKVDQTNSSYQLVARKIANTDEIPPKIISDFSLSSNASFSVNKSIFFGVKEQGEMVNLPAETPSESLAITQGGATKIITISNPFGVVEVN